MERVVEFFRVKAGWDGLMRRIAPNIGGVDGRFLMEQPAFCPSGCRRATETGWCRNRESAGSKRWFACFFVDLGERRVMNCGIRAEKKLWGVDKFLVDNALIDSRLLLLERR